MSAHHALLPGRALIALSGEDWRSFLQGLITQDVETLAPGEARFAALLTPQGKLMYDLFMVGRPDGAWLEVEADRREALIQRLAMYRLRAKVQIAADDAPVSALWGGEAPSDGGWVADPRLPALGHRGYGAAAPVTAEEADYDAHRLDLGVPGPADWGFEETYPIEANFDLLGGIDFKKGCFIGQETTSRMKRRGQIKTRMLPISFEGEGPAPGAEILAGTLRAGEVLSGRDGRAMASLRLDRIAGDLTADGWEVRVERPDWMAQALAPSQD
ncbi:YgfZ/GcvT domain-containing protein [Phenylobacterium aquaticum]|uniref:CAF17-like 4Fe-4S cluster assembly/insertion protein YgfZ n=1 Tax=Phenylobacterium aquaticum TaxID=1763816 RepID=UPI001F5C2CB8|nr:folate-binding protein YgfZ [Phenylobacterium aquaticum]MCI3131326.1 folate-binding protein YgfZ [Phenylobacterium aquaticum]